MSKFLCFVLAIGLTSPASFAATESAQVTEDTATAEQVLAQIDAIQTALNSEIAKRSTAKTVGVISFGVAMVIAATGVNFKGGSNDLSQMMALGVRTVSMMAAGAAVVVIAGSGVYIYFKNANIDDLYKQLSSARMKLIDEIAKNKATSNELQ